MEVLSANNTQKYIDVLPSMVEKYNYTYHRSIKLKPTGARKPANYKHINNVLYAKVNSRKATLPKFYVGDKVRIVWKKCTFEKGFTPNWTEEVFTNTAVKATKPPTYTIEQTLGEPVQGTFYEQELQSSVQEIYRIVTSAQEGKYRVLVKCTLNSYEYQQTVCLAVWSQQQSRKQSSPSSKCARTCYWKERISLLLHLLICLVVHAMER